MFGLRPCWLRRGRSSHRWQYRAVGATVVASTTGLTRREAFGRVQSGGVAASVVPWRLAVDPFEGSPEGERVRVADLGGDRREGVVGADEQVSREGQPPARQIGERRFAHLRGEAPREGSAR